MSNKLMQLLRKILTTTDDLRDAETGAARLDGAEREVKETLGLLQIRRENMMRAQKQQSGEGRATKP